MGARALRLRDWFEQYCDEEQYMAIQGAWIENSVADVFLFVMQGFKQSGLPIDLRVRAEAPDRVVAEISYREEGSPYGTFKLWVSPNYMVLSIGHPRWRPSLQQWAYTFDENHSKGFRDLPWDEWNSCLEWIE